MAFADCRDREPKAWVPIDDDKRKELVDEIAPLPSERGFGTEEAKRFDLLMLNLQLAALHVKPGFERLKEQARSIVGMLEDKSSIPMVREQMALIDAVSGEEWWQDVTVPMLETARKLGARRATLEVRASNEGARRLYERLGFSVAGVRHNYYASPVEDVERWSGRRAHATTLA